MSAIEEFIVGTGAGEYATLQAAIDAASEAVTEGEDHFVIRFSNAGAMKLDATLTIAEKAFSNGDTLTIDGDINRDGTADVTLDGKNSFRILDVGAANTVELNGLIFTNGSAEKGGAILTGGETSLNIANSTFTGNTAAQYGGAIATGGGELTVSNSIFTGNTAADNGGAVYVDSGEISLSIGYDENGRHTTTLTGGDRGKATFDECIIVGNTDKKGHSVYATKYVESLEITQSKIDSVKHGTAENLTVSDTTLTGLKASDVFANIDADGNAVLNADGSVELAGNTNEKYFVVGTGAGEYATVQDAVNAAANALTGRDDHFVIQFSNAGTVKLDSTLTIAANTFINGDTLTIDGDIDGDGAADVILDGQNTVRIMEINKGNTVELNGLIFTNGSAEKGGAIYCDSGFGLGCSDVDICYVTISNSSFTGNTATGSGGAIFNNHNANMTIVNSTFTGNTASKNGGAVYFYAGDLNVANSTFTGNTAARNGGAVFIMSGTLSYNPSTWTVIGGFFGKGSFTNCILVGNSDRNGNSVHAYEHVTLNMNYSLLDHAAAFEGSVINENSCTTGLTASDVFISLDDNGNAAAESGTVPVLKNEYVLSGTKVGTYADGYAYWDKEAGAWCDVKTNVAVEVAVSVIGKDQNGNSRLENDAEGIYSAGAVIGIDAKPETPVEPSEPEIPVEPSEPEIPVEPSEPEIPVEPSEPEIPVEPSGPEIPVEPSEPEQIPETGVTSTSAQQHVLMRKHDISSLDFKLESLLPMVLQKNLDTRSGNSGVSDILSNPGSADYGTFAAGENAGTAYLLRKASLAKDTVDYALEYMLGAL